MIRILQKNATFSDFEKIQGLSEKTHLFFQKKKPNLVRFEKS